MRRVSHSLRMLLHVLLVPMAGAGCSSDEPTSIEDILESPWSEVLLPKELPNGALTSIAFRNGRGLAMQITEREGSIILESTPEGWAEAEAVPELRGTTIVDIAIDATGRGAIVGFNGSSRPQALAFVEQPEWTSVLPGAPPWGAFLALDVDDSGNFRAAGFEINRLAVWAGAGDESWSEIPIAAPGRANDKALVDIAAGPKTWVACGFDDGGEGTLEEPFSILMMDEGSGWELIHVPCGGCGNVEYMAVAIHSSGTIYLGGAVTDFSGGSQDPYVAFLWAYARDIEEWTEIALPEPGSLNRVNEILLAASGDIYLACGVAEAALVRLPFGESSATATHIEWRADNTRLLGLGEASDGTIHAVGIGDTRGAGPPLMLQRR